MVGQFAFNSNRHFWLFILWTVAYLFPTFAEAATIPVIIRGEPYEKDYWIDKPLYYFDTLGLPKGLTKSYLKTLLEEFSKQKKGVAFQFLGDWRDFDHAHLLSHENQLKAFLFHTQERANIAPKGNKFSTLDQTKRNWIVFFNRPAEIFDAMMFRFDSQPSSWNVIFGKNVTWEQYAKANTVAEMMIDPKKIGFPISSFDGTEKTLSIQFKKAKCPTKPIKNVESSNLLNIESGGEVLCLYVNTLFCQFDGQLGNCPARKFP